jgi:hypothetical protein
MSIETDKHSEPHGSVVCPKCLRSNSTTAAFCADCGAPIGMVAAVDPIQQIHAEGFAYRSAVDGPPKLIILIGMWLLFGPLALMGPTLLIDGASNGIPKAILFNILSACSAIILYRTTRNYIVKSRLARARIV